MDNFLLLFTVSAVCPHLCFSWPLISVQAQKSDPLKSWQQVDLERAHFLVTQAFEEDEKGNDDEAIELYTQAVELCIKTVDHHFLSLLAPNVHFSFQKFIPAFF